MKRCRVKHIKHRWILLFSALVISCGSDSSVETKVPSEHLYDNEILNPEISIYQEQDLVISSTSRKLTKDEGKDAILTGEVISKFFGSSDVSRGPLLSESGVESL